MKRAAIGPPGAIMSSITCQGPNCDQRLTRLAEQQYPYYCRRCQLSYGRCTQCHVVTSRPQYDTCLTHQLTATGAVMSVPHVARLYGIRHNDTWTTIEHPPPTGF